MTRDEAGHAMELLHGYGMSAAEIACAIECTVIEVEYIKEKVMKFHSKFNPYNKLIVKQSKINTDESY